MYAYVAGNWNILCLHASSEARGRPAVVQVSWSLLQ